MTTMYFALPWHSASFDQVADLVGKLSGINPKVWFSMLLISTLIAAVNLTSGQKRSGSLRRS